jgi:hypothetical protein
MDITSSKFTHFITSLQNKNEPIPIAGFEPTACALRHFSGQAGS